MGQTLSIRVKLGRPGENVRDLQEVGVEGVCKLTGTGLVQQEETECPN